MEAQLLDRTPIQARFRVTIPAEEVDRTFDAVLNSLARQVRVPGFRPGRAPRGVLVRRIGEEALGNEVREALVDGNYPGAVEELGLSPVHVHLDAEAPVEGEAYVFEAEVDLYPEITLPDLTEIIIDTEGREVSEEDLDQAVEQLAQQHATLVPVERGIDPKDYVVVERQSEDGSGSTLPIDLERASDSLVEQLLGKVIGDSLELTVESPIEDEEPTVLDVVVVDVKEKDLPELDDDFAMTLGLESWDEALARIRENLQSQLDEETFSSQREEFVEKLLAETSFDIPRSLIDRRKIRMLENLAEDLSRRNLTLEGYLGSLEADGKREEFDDDLNQSAESAVRRDLVLEKLHEVVGTEIDNEEFNHAIGHLAAREGKDVARFKRDMGESWLANYRYLMARDTSLRNVVQEKVSAKKAIIVE